MGELEDTMTEEAELKRERETRVHCRHTDGLRLGATFKHHSWFRLAALLVNASYERG
jgi:hypothetical protein